jgi:hypothetical protein
VGSLSASLVLVSCGSWSEDSSSSSSSSSSSVSSSASRPTVVSVLSKFANENATNAVNFKFLANEGSTATPVLQIQYVPEGYQVNFLQNWDSSKTNYGYINIPSGSSKAAEGVYKYSLSDGSLALGEQLSGYTDVYDAFYTPKYLSDNAEVLTGLFAATSKTDTVQLTDASYLDPVAKALGTYGILTAISGVSIAYVNLTYTASSTTFVYDVYINYDASVYWGARATIGYVNKTTVSAISTYLGD